MIVLSVDPQKLSRTTTRKQWREIARWLRVTRNRILQEFGVTS